MKKANLYLVSKSLDLHEEKIKNCLQETYTFKSFSDLQFIPSTRNTRPLLSPAQIIILFTESWAIEDLHDQINELRSRDGTSIYFSVLFICNEKHIEDIDDLIRENDDFIEDHFTTKTLLKKIRQIAQRSNLYKKLSRDLNEASEIALLSMSHSSELGEISRFILNSYNCLTYEELLDTLFETIVVFGVHCSALIVVDDTVIFRLIKEANPETRKLMLKHHNLGRIHHFGTEIIITFAHASMLIHDMPIENDSHYSRLMDNLTILGNCFEARVKGIHAEQEADAASRSKTMFLATMSHELRTPMNSVIGFTERLIEKLNGRITPKEEKHLQAIKRNGDHLLSLINDILDVSKIEVGKMEIHPEEISAVEEIKNIYSQLQPIAQNNDLDFELIFPKDEIFVHADPKRFTQVVMNLVSNAIKYTAKGKVTITISEKQDEHIGECLNVDVSDTGIGISEDDQKKLFSNFVQIDSKLSRRVDGTGLGLVISNFFADMHGGRIHLESEVGVGSSFSLCLPLINNPKSPEIDDHAYVHEPEIEIKTSKNNPPIEFF